MPWAAAADCLRAAETREVLPSNGPDDTGIIPDEDDEESFCREKITN